MDGIIERMNQVTDHSEIKKLQAQQNVDRTREHLDDVLNKANAAGLTVHMPLTFESPKERRIRNVIENTLKKLPMNDHAEAIAKIGKAAETGYVAKDLMGSDAHVHTDTVVDHSTSSVFTPPTVTHHTTAHLKDPEDYMPAAKAITAGPLAPPPLIAPLIVAEATKKPEEV